MRDEHHPVWSVYDLYRTSRLNVKYYSAKLHRAENEIFWMDCILLITAPSSSIAGFWFLQNPVGEYSWKILGAIAAIIAILKPLLNRTKKVKNYEELRAGYRAFEHDLHVIKENIIQKRSYDLDLQNEFQKALKRIGILKNKEVDSEEDKALKIKFTKEVLTELPTDQFYIPEE